MYGMRKTTVYLPDDLKRLLEDEARRRETSEAALIREAVERLVRRPAPRAGLFCAEPFAARAEELLDGFGER